MSQLFKISSLNANAGDHPEFLKYVERQLKNNRVDVIVMQEVHHCLNDIPAKIRPHSPNGANRMISTNLYREIMQIADAYGYTGIFTPQIEGLHDYSPYNGVWYGNLTLYRNEFPCIRSTCGMIYGQFGQMNTEKEGGTPAGKSGQIITLRIGDSDVTIMNVHGHHSRNGKHDSNVRIAQNEGITNMLARHGATRLTVLLGDLNYTSEMYALRNLMAASVLGQNGMVGTGVNLNERWNIMSTRTVAYAKPCREADFAICTPDFAEHVRSYVVDPETPSDHCTLKLTVEI